MPELWTIGHSVLPLDAFLDRLRAHSVALIADVRRYPVSQRQPHFESRALEAALANAGIRYRHFTALGGHREPRPDSTNLAWRNTSFRGYADYMETAEFRTAAAALADEARQARVAMMCSEGDWRRCHRGLLADWFRAAGWRTLHIADEGPAREHPGTEVAQAKERILPLFGEET
jgi:uncharacterized protein (DUF488 family)